MDLGSLAAGWGKCFEKDCPLKIYDTCQPLVSVNVLELQPPFNIITYYIGIKSPQK